MVSIETSKIVVQQRKLARQNQQKTSTTIENNTNNNVDSNNNNNNNNSSKNIDFEKKSQKVANQKSQSNEKSNHQPLRFNYRTKEFDSNAKMLQDNATTKNDQLVRNVPICIDENFEDVRSQMNVKNDIIINKQILIHNKQQQHLNRPKQATKFINLDNRQCKEISCLEKNSKKQIKMHEINAINLNKNAISSNSDNNSIELVTKNVSFNICSGCSRPIREQFLLEALGKRWHEDCLKCACCECRLGEVGSSLFVHLDKMFCRRDFLRIFGQKGFCPVCRKSIEPYELVMRAKSNAYHIECFACQQCQARFCVGDQFCLWDPSKIVCFHCHQTASTSISSAEIPIDSTNPSDEQQLIETTTTTTIRSPQLNKQYQLSNKNNLDILTKQQD